MSRLFGIFRRYFGVAAAFVYSGGNFLLALLLQKLLPPAEFGIFALIQVFVQLGIGISNGLLCSPIIIALKGEGAFNSVVASFSKASVIACAIGAALLSLYVATVRQDILLTLSVAAYGFVSWSRWFFRSVELAANEYVTSALADITYGAVVVCGSIVLFLAHSASIRAAFVVQVVGCCAAMFVMGRVAWRALLAAPSSSLDPFVRSAKQHGAWALVGVITTEATANAHPYLIGLMLGPAAFAPIAAVTLFFRPITIVAQALTQYERPRMAHAIAERNENALQNDVRAFTLASLLAWLGNSALVLVLVFIATGLIGRKDYPASEIHVSAILLIAVFLVRALRGAESAALQAGGYFRPLAWASVVAAPLTAIPAAIVVMIRPTEPVWSLLGVLLGEAVMCALIRRLYSKHLAQGATPMRMVGI